MFFNLITIKPAIRRNAMILVAFVILQVFPFDSTAQYSSDTTYVPLNMLRIEQQNDLYQYWYQSDENFSDGIHIELTHSIFNNKIADWFLVGFKNTPYNDFSLGFIHEIFTPANTRIKEVDSTDRPYTALLFLTYSKNSNLFYKGRKLTSSFYLGLEGKGALGKELQNGVHGILGNNSANGWDNQLGSGLMLDYEITYSQLLSASGKFFETNAYENMRIGSIHDYVKTGINFKIGHYTDTYVNYDGIINYRNKFHITEEQFSAFSKSKKKLIPKSIRKRPIAEQIKYLNKRLNRRAQYYVVFDLQASYIFYDGTRNGSLLPLSRNSYEYPLEQGNRFVVQGSYSLNFQYGRFIMRFNRFLESDVFLKGNVFGFGEISLSLVL